jgi:hypothetical protein
VRDWDLRVVACEGFGGGLLDAEGGGMRGLKI